MKYTKFATTAMIAIAATGIAAGTSYAAPGAQAPAAAQVTPAAASQGTQDGVDYSVRLAETGNTVVTQVTGGAFQLAADGKAVTLKNDAGQVVAQLPLVGAAGAEQIALTAVIDEQGQRLSLTAPAASDVSVRFIGSQERFFAELQRASLGALIGAIIGAFFFGIGLPFGALIGLLIAGGPSLIDAGLAYFGGQP
ncbi:hypothetical protein ABZ319_33320 [Nocardia sp. NPDC005978]|uniref:hypothetical protein n=1 Tax=Nocardia sp. NPDC005978 TaxID=3156725 RepID=UPI0033A3260E